MCLFACVMHLLRVCIHMCQSTHQKSLLKTCLTLARLSSTPAPLRTGSHPCPHSGAPPSSPSHLHKEGEDTITALSTVLHCTALCYCPWTILNNDSNTHWHQIHTFSLHKEDIMITAIPVGQHVTSTSHNLPLLMTFFKASAPCPEAFLALLVTAAVFQKVNSTRDDLNAALKCTKRTIHLMTSVRAPCCVQTLNAWCTLNQKLRWKWV